MNLTSGILGGLLIQGFKILGFIVMGLSLLVYINWGPEARTVVLIGLFFGGACEGAAYLLAYWAKH